MMNRWTMGFLVALRIAIGWHFLYEGLWKIRSDTGAVTYNTAWYTLQASIARMRSDFDHGAGPARAQAWFDEVVKTFKGRNRPLDEPQKARLAELRDKVMLAAWEGSAEPVNFDWLYVRDEVLHLAAEQEGERFTSLPYLQASEGPFRPVFRGLVHDIEGFERVTVPSAQAALDRRYTEIVRLYFLDTAQQQRLTIVRDALKQSIADTLNDPLFQARLADYRRMHDRAAANDAVDAPFTRERRAEDRKKLDAIAGELLGFVNEPLSELAVQAQSIATVQQIGAGPLPRPGDPAGWIDRSIACVLTAIGLTLMLGLFTPYAALAAACQLAMFYLASPPWPGMPAATLGGHYLYIDRNVIELAAALVIAVSGTGRLGLDAYLSRISFWRSR